MFKDFLLSVFLTFMISRLLPQMQIWRNKSKCSHKESFKPNPILFAWLNSYFHANMPHTGKLHYKENDNTV